MDKYDHSGDDSYYWGDSPLDSLNEGYFRMIDEISYFSSQQSDWLMISQLKKDYIPLFLGRPVRGEITEDDILNLRIDIETGRI